MGGGFDALISKKIDPGMNNEAAVLEMMCVRLEIAAKISEPLAKLDKDGYY